MTTQRWLRFGSAAAALALLLALAAAWHSAVRERRRAEDIGTRTQEAIERIEARARALENEAGR